MLNDLCIQKYTKQQQYEWLVGIIDGDGFLDLERTRSRNQYYYRPVLAITQKQSAMLYNIKALLGIGQVSKRSDGVYHYRVRSKKLFEQHLIPIFQKHPFYTNKQLQFRLIVRSLKLLENYSSNHIHKQQQLDRLKQWIQKARKRSCKTPTHISKAWLVGFFDSEGSISVQATDRQRLRYRFNIKITQSWLHYELLIGIQSQLNIGKVYEQRPQVYYWGVQARRHLPKLRALWKRYRLQ